MALVTKCQTPGAWYHASITQLEHGSLAHLCNGATCYIEAKVELPFDLNLTEDDAKLLEANIHNALELVLAPYFRGSQ